MHYTSPDLSECVEFKLCDSSCDALAPGAGRVGVAGDAGLMKIVNTESWVEEER